MGGAGRARRATATAASPPRSRPPTRSGRRSTRCCAGSRTPTGAASPGRVHGVVLTHDIDTPWRWSGRAARAGRGGPGQGRRCESGARATCRPRPPGWPRLPVHRAARHRSQLDVRADARDRAPPRRPLDPLPDGRPCPSGSTVWTPRPYDRLRGRVVRSSSPRAATRSACTRPTRPATTATGWRPRSDLLAKGWPAAGGQRALPLPAPRHPPRPAGACPAGVPARLDARAIADRPGLRAGFSHPYRPYDLAADRPLDLIELPLAVMDATLQDAHYLGLSPGAGLRAGDRGARAGRPRAAARWRSCGTTTASRRAYGRGLGPGLRPPAGLGPRPRRPAVRGRGRARRAVLTTRGDGVAVVSGSRAQAAWEKRTIRWLPRLDDAFERLDGGGHELRAGAAAAARRPRPRPTSPCGRRGPRSSRGTRRRPRSRRRRGARRCRPARRGSRGRPSARATSAPGRRPPPSPGCRAMMSAPITVCCFMTVNSSSVSGPGLLRIGSGMPILPTSCSSAPIRTARSSRPGQPQLLADGDRELGDRLGVAAGVGVLRLQRRGQRRRRWPDAAPPAARPSARRPARSRRGRPAAGRTGGRPGEVRRPGVEQLDQARPRAPSMTSGASRLASKPISSRKRVLGGIAAVADRGRRLDQLGRRTRRVRRVLVERVVLGDHVQLGRRDHVRGPVGHRRRRRRRTRRSGRRRRRTAASARARTATWPPAVSAASASARVDSITAIRSSKRRWELSGTHGASLQPHRRPPARNVATPERVTT